MGIRSKAAVVLLLAGILWSLVPTQIGNAHGTIPPTLSPLRYGYFTGSLGPTNLDIGTVITTGLMNGVYPSSSTARSTIMNSSNWAFDLTNKAQFINYIEGRFNGSGRNRVGAAFIIQNMRGVSSPSGQANFPTAAEVQDWKNRINSGSVTLSVDQYASETVNSAYMQAHSETEYRTTSCSTAPFPAGPSDGVCSPPRPSGFSSNGNAYVSGNTTWSRNWRKTTNYSDGNDVMYYHAHQDLPALTFRQNGTIVTRIKINCANLVGGYGGIDDPGYEMSPLNASPGTPGVNHYGMRTVDVVKGDDFTVTSRVTNAGTVAGPQYFHIMRPINDTHNGWMRLYLTRNGFSDPGGDSAGNGVGGYSAVSWGYKTTPGPLNPGQFFTANATYSMNGATPVGTVFCWFGIMDPFPSGGADRFQSPVSERICVRVVAPPVGPPPPPPTVWEYRSRVIDSLSTAEGTYNAGGNIGFGSDSFNPTTTFGTARHNHRVFVSSSSVAANQILEPLDYSRTNNDSQALFSGTGSTTVTWDDVPITASGDSTDKTAQYGVRSDAPNGSWFCLQSSTDPIRGNSSGAVLDSGRHYSEERCYTVTNERFDLSVTVTGPSLMQPGDPNQAIDYTICNADALPAGSIRGIAPSVLIEISGAIGSNLSTTQDISSNSSNCWTETRQFSPPSTATVGQQFCTTLATDKDSGFSNNTGLLGRNDIQHCVTVGVSPYLQVNYGDVWAGADFDTALNFPVPAACGTVHNDSQIKSVTYQDSISSLWRGSFVEYGAYATGSISNFGSSNAPNGTLLTFATDPNLGNYTNTPKCIPNYYGLLNESAHTYAPNTRKDNPNSNISSFRNNDQTFVRGSFIFVGQRDITGDRTIVIEGDLIINGDMTLASTNFGNSTSLDVPSLVFVVNGDIFIDQSVKEVDAILISHGNVWTCTSGSTLIRELADGVCDEPLTINGAIVANRVNFMRTHEGNGRIGGVHDVNSQPAEVINFLPEFYLSDPIFKSDYIDGNSFETVLIKDLPPIY